MHWFEGQHHQLTSLIQRLELSSLPSQCTCKYVSNTFIGHLQVVMMVGLPGSGKTSWAHKYCRDNISKKYNILGADDIVQNIRVSVSLVMSGHCFVINLRYIFK